MTALDLKRRRGLLLSAEGKLDESIQTLTTAAACYSEIQYNGAGALKLFDEIGIGNPKRVAVVQFTDGKHRTRGERS